MYIFLTVDTRGEKKRASPLHKITSVTFKRLLAEPAFRYSAPRNKTYLAGKEMPADFHKDLVVLVWSLVPRHDDLGTRAVLKLIYLGREQKNNNRKKGRRRSLINPTWGIFFKCTFNWNGQAKWSLQEKWKKYVLFFVHGLASCTPGTTASFHFRTF